MGKTQKFKTDIAFLTIQDLSSEDHIKVIFIAEDFSGCIYERLIDITYLEELSPIFIFDSSLFFLMLKYHPTTTFEKDSILCKYKFSILGRDKEITFPIEPKTYQSLNSEMIDLKKSIQCLSIQLRTQTIIMEKLFTSNYLMSNVFNRSDLEAMSFYGLLTIQNPITGRTFLHEAIDKFYTLEVVDKVLFNVNILDRDGYPPIFVHSYHDGEKTVECNNIKWDHKDWKKQYDLTLQIVKSGCNLNYCHLKATKGTRASDPKETLFLTQLKNNVMCLDQTSYPDKGDASIRLISEMLKHGANVKGLTLRKREYSLRGSGPNTVELVKLLISYGANVIDH